MVIGRRAIREGIIDWEGKYFNSEMFSFLSVGENGVQSSWHLLTEIFTSKLFCSSFVIPQIVKFPPSSVHCRKTITSATAGQFHGSSLRLLLLLLIVTCCCWTVIQAEECGHEELVQCAKPLQVISATSELSFVTNKRELEQICP